MSASLIDLPMIWAAIIAFAVFAYVVMDGFDLGIGILFPVFAVGEERDQAMNSIAPVWDGNETWLVLGGGGLFAAFPLAFAIIMPAVYPLVIAMLLGLVFRGVAFEFRFRDPSHRPYWDAAFTIGSVVAAFAQGMILGALLQGIAVENRAYGGGWLDWLSPFSLLTGVSTVIGYALLGATWLIWKTEGRAQEHARRLAWTSFIGTLIAILAVSLATPFLAYGYYQRWFTFPNVLVTAQVPLLTAILAAMFWLAMRRQHESWPFFLALALFLMCFAGLGVSMYPYVVPDKVTIWDAAAPHRSQSFMLVGVVIILPLILAYTSWAYWVFRGKAGTEGYH
ncbi:cytochrome d ubiquinol oxidase subunit II [Methylocella sp. CPCC 101449]|uniref:cytochrome d ubiquinol oxidase subunit II n=1 Tax=Methylocella sp. CPCC 101449 TaxID=2987531 RepID=UPI0028914929|nr:cytochrome d ubiquinol oxidase subunit II [Methylocella sp. CPCC 101449]MDT2021969.1 cytochrome d ubiquinol oxidase subunit II [Methylocella sp. CPCC 101449]